MTSIPFSMLEPPAKATCPPPLTANGQLVSFEILTNFEIDVAEVASSLHAGVTSDCWTDQYGIGVYPAVPKMETLPGFKIESKAH